MASRKHSFLKLQPDAIIKELQQITPAIEGIKINDIQNPKPKIATEVFLKYSSWLTSFKPNEMENPEFLPIDQNPAKSELTVDTSSFKKAYTVINSYHALIKIAQQVNFDFSLKSFIKPQCDTFPIQLSGLINFSRFRTQCLEHFHAILEIQANHKKKFEEQQNLLNQMKEEYERIKQEKEENQLKENEQNEKKKNLEKDFQNSLKNIEILQNKIDTASKNLQVINETLSSRENTVIIQQQNLENLKRALQQNTESKIEDIQEELNNMYAKNGSIAKELYEKSHKKEFVSQCRESLIEVTDTLQEIIDSFLVNNENDQNKIERDQLQAEVDALKMSIQQKDQQIQLLENQKEAIQNQKQEENEEMKKIRDEYQKLHKQEQRLITDIDDIKRQFEIDLQDEEERFQTYLSDLKQSMDSVGILQLKFQ